MLMRVLVLFLFGWSATAFAQFTPSGGGSGSVSGWQLSFRCNLQGGATACPGSSVPSSVAPGLSSSINPGDPLFSTGVFGSRPAASAGKTYLATDGSSAACTAGGGSTSCYTQSNGSTWALVTVGTGFWVYSGAAASSWQISLLIPSGYTAGNITVGIIYRSADSTNAATLTWNSACVAAGTQRDTAPLATTGTGPMSIAQGNFKDTLFTFTMNPTCAIGNALTFQWAITPGSSTNTNEVQVTEVYFKQ